MLILSALNRFFYNQNRKTAPIYMNYCFDDSPTLQCIIAYYILSYVKITQKY